MYIGLEAPVLASIVEGGFTRLPLERVLIESLLVKGEDIVECIVQWRVLVEAERRPLCLLEGLKDSPKEPAFLKVEITRTSCILIPHMDHGNITCNHTKVR